MEEKRNYIKIKNIKIEKGDLIRYGDFNIAGKKIEPINLVITDINILDRYSYANIEKENGDYAAGTIMEGCSYPYLVEILEKNFTREK